MQISISNHIEKLLFEHDTVIVPALGGFTATRTSASIEVMGGTFGPPSKSLSFNEHLTVDDGILVHDIARAYNITAEEARIHVLDFVSQTQAALNQREIIALPGVGRLYKNYAQKIQFLPDATNFNLDSFGLGEVHFNPISRSMVEEKAKDSRNSNGHAKGVAVLEPPMPSVNHEVSAAEKQIIEPATPANTTAVIPDEPVKEPKQRPSKSLMLQLAVVAVAVALGILAFKSKIFQNSGTTIAKTAAPTPPGSLPGVAPAPTPENAVAATVVEEDEKNTDIPDEVEEIAEKRTAAMATVSGKKETDSKKAPKSLESPKKKNEEATPAGSRRCVLIIGTFQNKTNVEKLKTKLEAAGFDTYHRFEKGHQVGVEFFYKDLVEVQAQIKKLQEVSGENNIWIKKK